MGFMSLVLSVLYGCCDFWKEKLFTMVKRAFDPSANVTSEDEFDMDSFSKWSSFENVFSFVLFLILYIPGLLSMSSTWRWAIFLHIPRLRKKGRAIVSIYRSLERGYRVSCTISSIKDRNVSSSLFNASALLAIFLEQDSNQDSVAGVLLLRQVSAFWQSVFTLGWATSDRRWFSLLLNVFQLFILFFGSLRLLTLFEWTTHLPWWWILMTSIYLLQTTRNVVGLLLRQK